MPGFGKSKQLMKTSRRDGGGAGPEKMSPFKRITTEFGEFGEFGELGAWKATSPGTPTSTTNPSIMMSSGMILGNAENPRSTAAPIPSAPTPSPASANATTRPWCRTFKPRGSSCRHGTPRYSKIDTFIETLDAARKALPTPLVDSASPAPPPPACRATPTKELLYSSSTKEKDRHPHHQHARKTLQHHQEDHHPLSSTGGIVKEVKFADEVIEIGESGGMVAERTSEVMSTSSERNGFEVRSFREPPGGKKMMVADGAGAPPRFSRALRFDYRKKRSDFVKAATVVQSTYRGYTVRKGQPLKYLVAISSVKEKLEELRQQFDAWKIAAWFPTDLTERVTMTESVMDLLLQLDSLQGVPVMVREFRKNVAQDVIKFQEEVDGFLCRNSKHGVLCDLTRPGAKAAQGISNLKPPNHAIRNIVVQEPNYIENLPESDSKACSTRHNGSLKEDAKVGSITSVNVTSGLESVSQSKISEVSLYSVQPHGSTGRNFVLWPPGDAKFEKVTVEEQSREENQLEIVTELKKCVASTGNLTINVPPDRKKKSLRVRFGTVSSGNRTARRESLSTDDECPNEPPEDTGPCNSTHVESMMKDVHHPPDILSWGEPTGYCQKKDDSQCTVSINKQRSLDPYANGRIQFPNDGRIHQVHEDLVEDCEIRYPQTHARPQTPAQSNYSLTEKWDAEFPAEAHLDNSIEIHTSYVGRENGQDLEIRHPQLAQPDYSLREKWEAEFPADFPCNNRIEINKSCTDMENTPVRHPQLAQPEYLLREKWEAEFPADFPCNNLIEIDTSCIGMENTPIVMSEPNPAKDEDLHIPAEEVIRKDLNDKHLRLNPTNLQAFPFRVEYVSAKDVREGTIKPLLASDQEDSELDYPVGASQLDLSSKDTFRSFGEHEDIDSLGRGSEGNRMGMSQDMPKGFDAKKGDPCGVVALTEGEKLDKLEIPGIEAIKVGQSVLLNNSEHSPILNTPTSIFNGSVREQLDGQSGNEYDPCGFEDLETISSCSNCPAYPADCVGEPWDESGIHEQVRHQPYALKGLIMELDEVLSERKGEGKLFEVDQWKDEAWRDYTITEFRPCHITAITSKPDFPREVEVEREDDSCKSFKTVESDKIQYFRRTEQKFVAGPKTVAPHQEDYREIKELTCPESRGSNLDCTSQSSGVKAVASGSTTSLSHENETNMLYKLVEDSKRLKGLLKEVMKWNTVQANAMITLNERLELVESKK